MKELKKIVEPSHNVSHEEFVSIDDLKINNAREREHALEEETMKYYWFVKHKYQRNLHSIHLYYAKFLYLKTSYHSLGLLQAICLMQVKTLFMHY